MTQTASHFYAALEHVVTRLQADLRERTGDDWQVTVRSVHWDVQFICRCRDWTCQTACLDVGRVAREGLPVETAAQIVDYWHWRQQTEAHE